MVASSNLAERHLSRFEGSIRVLGAPSLDALQEKAERAESNGTPYEALGYGLETGRGTPDDEWQDMVGSTQKAREIADQHGKLLLMAPGFRLMSENQGKYAPMAALADLWVIQTQRLQVNPPGPAYRTGVMDIVVALRSENPDISIWAQITLPPDRAPSADDWLAYHETIADLVDGTYVGIYTWDSANAEQLLLVVETVFGEVCGGRG
jgi:hypothetical protein